MSVAEVLPHIVTAWAMAAVNGDVLVGKKVRRACERHLYDLKRSTRKNATIWFDEVEATKTIRFFETLRHSKGRWRGKPFKLGPWQCFLEGCGYGWKRCPTKESDGKPDWSVPREKWPRRFRTIYGELPRKQGKSTLGAGNGLKGLAADREGAPEVYAAATKREQAKIVFAEAQRMARQTPALKRRMKIFNNRLEYPKNDGFFVAISSDATTADGLNPSTLIIDELHAHKNRDFFDILDTATGARVQPMMFIITTAGDLSNPESIYNETHEYASAVLDGFDKRKGPGVVHDDTFFAFIATIDDDDDWTDPKCWGKANLNLGVSVKTQDLLSKLAQAIAIPARAIAFKRLYLNVRTSSLAAWLPIEAWDACGEPFDEDLLIGRKCHGALDLSSRRDTTAWVLLFPPVEDDPFWRLLVRSFMPEANIDARELDTKLPYRAWAEAGWLTLTPGDTVDQDIIRKKINSDAQDFDIEDIGFDEWNAVNLVRVLKDDDGFDMVLMRQGMKTLALPTKDFEDMVIGGTLRHGGNPLLRHQAQSVIVRYDDNMNYMPAKKKSRTHIDGIVGGIMAKARADADDGLPDIGGLIASGNAVQ
tara:strand:+ start:6523 stop:8295 length:1773 start_codon:yes stop_codon:yes gene_type:complete